MPWWGWVLVTWPVVAVVVALALGGTIRLAERRELSADRPDEDPPTEVRRNAVRLVENLPDRTSDGPTGTDGQRMPR
ncbi:hypothetical protein [Geodermatophilus sp. URMC 62]|uniref:hypothetical protein n=1 Tax=Geodermatophilus sp. URMC 62 TaxID=3423414 RepID=UPI00406CBD57